MLFSGLSRTFRNQESLEVLVRTLAKRALTYLHDLCVVALSIIVAIILRLGWDGFTFGIQNVIAVAVAVTIAAVIFPIFGLNRGIWRYASIPDLVAIVSATTVMMLLFVVAIFLIGPLLPLPRSVPGIAWFIQVILLSAPRILLRFFRDHRRSLRYPALQDREALLLYGLQDSAANFIRAVNRTGSASRVVGLVDDRVKNRGRVILGVPILGTLEDIAEIVAGLEASGSRPTRMVLVNEFDRATMRSILERVSGLNLKVARAPNPTELIDARNEKDMTLKPIELEDLLGRKTHSLQTLFIKQMISGKRVLVTGAGGSIGSELCRQVVQYGPARLTMLDSSEFNLYSIDQDISELVPALDRSAIICSVRDRRRIEHVLRSEQPELVFHAAALKHVPMVEANVCEGVLTNVFGTINVADSAREVGTRAFVLISTDKAVNPTNVMGATKRIAEQYCQALDRQGGETRFMTVRFGNVLGSTGSVVPLFEKQLRKGGPLTVTDPEISRYFMTISEAVALVLQASVYGLSEPKSAGRIFVLDMGEPIKIVDLAQNMIRLAGLEPDVDVRVEFTGLRPGEKLYEELFSSKEPPQVADVDGILVAAPRNIELAILRKLCRDLELAAESGDTAKARSQISAIVPEFGPQQTEVKLAAREGE